MSFFKDFKEDLSQAVNELLPDSEKPATEPEPEMLPEEDKDLELEGGLDSLLMNMNGDFSENIPEDSAAIEYEAVENTMALLDMEDNIEEAVQDGAAEPEGIMLDDMPEYVNTFTEETEESAEASAEEPASEEIIQEPPAEAIIIDDPVEETQPEEVLPESIAEPLDDNNDNDNVSAAESADITINTNEEKKMSDMVSFEEQSATDENSIITEGMIIDGNIKARGSLEVLGVVNGNIEIKGKLDISGTINGNSKAAEIFADSAKINGEIQSLGAVKIGQQSVIIGDVSATSAVIAGAVKGNIDVHGPVILDTTAIVMGDIKSKSVQINNGAVIEGRCSQCYADVSPTSFFNDL